MWQDDPDFANKATAMCYKHYAKLGKKGKPQEGKEWTLVAAILCVEQQGTFYIIKLFLKNNISS